MSWSSPARLGPTGAVVMQFGAAARAVTLLLLAVAVVGFVLLTTRLRGNETNVPRLLLAAVVLALGAATVDVFGVAHRLRPDGIERVTPWSRRAVIRWSEVTSIEWVERARWFEVRARGGERVRVPEQLGGMASFARSILEGVPAAVLDARAGLRQRLELLAGGTRPPDEPEPEAWRGG